MKYNVGDKVWVKPIETGYLAGVVISHQKIGEFNPIIEFEYAGKKKSNAFTLNRIMKMKTSDEIFEMLKKEKTNISFLRLIKSLPKVELVYDGDWSWVEYMGEEIEGTGKERFSTTKEIRDLLTMAGL